jgi:hypothetical protein
VIVTRAIGQYLATLVERIGRQTNPSVLALIGDWGGGKSSVLNLTMAMVSDRDEWQVAEFNPWFYSDLDAVLVEVLRRAVGRTAGGVLHEVHPHADRQGGRTGESDRKSATTRTRDVLLHKQRGRRRTLAPPGRVWGLIQELLVGYGYRPLLAGLWILVLLAAGTAFFAVTPPGAVRADPPAFSAPAYTLALLLPVVNLGQEAAWSPHGPGQTIAYCLIVAGWILATAVIAGVTRQLVRP